MRYILKGGVWKNAEDEILKAAVMKYGLNQWERVSSLLVRKSAKQCKARWYEWLDPSIKKTEWTRAEEEKLLHLSKIFPCQWRTIAPIVGRTPAQCVEHYEKLLDQAQGKEGDDENDPRKLKPGEIDPAPEIKPAKPDPIDMDEDMKQMLAEARVRLANTRGKKAKRLARERQIEDARKSALLQKQRELRAAGIEYIIKKKKKDPVDYNKEIPFERVVPQVKFDPDASETPKPNLDFGNINIMKLEGTKQFIEYEKRKLEDQEKMKKLKEKDLPSAISIINKQNNPIMKPKTKLIMPTPQLHDKDLELLGKMNSQTSMGMTGENAATKALLGNYTIRETTTSVMRTPRQMDSILIQAQNAAAQRNLQTPLLGGENVRLVDEKQFNAGKAQVPSTPNQFSTLLGQAYQTPSNVPKSQQQSSIIRPLPKMTPMHMNQDELIDANWEQQSGQPLNAEKLEKLKQQQIKQTIKDSLRSLPKPKQEYLIEIPEIEDNDDNKMEEEVIDAEDYERMQEEKIRQDEETKLKNQSLVIQKNLPRPYQTPESIYNHITENKQISLPRIIIEEILNNEMQDMLKYDSIQHPIPGVKPVLDFDINSYDMFEKNELKAAEGLIYDEIHSIKKNLNQEEFKEEEFNSSWNQIYSNFIKNTSVKSLEELSNIPLEEQIQIFQNQFKQLKQFYVSNSLFLNTYQETQLIQVNNQEKKLKIILSGYAKRHQTVSKLIQDKYEILDQYEIQSNVYSLLKDNENIALNIRLNEAKQFHKALVGKEQELQNKYQQITEIMKELKKEDELFEKQ